jgi:hypothetical protein
MSSLVFPPVGLSRPTNGKRVLWRPILPTRHQTLPRASPEPPRSTLDPDRGYYGEAPVRLRRDERAVGGAVRPIPAKTAKNRETESEAGSCWLRRQRQEQTRYTTGVTASVLERQGAAVGFGDLPAQGQTYA